MTIARRLHAGHREEGGTPVLWHIGRVACVELIARAAGQAGKLARQVKMADLEDRCRDPRVRTDGWSPPYARAIGQLLKRGDADRHLPMATCSTAGGRPPYAVNPQLAVQIKGDSRTW